MSITGSTETIQLKSMDMRELQQHLTSAFDTQEMESELESMNDDELMLKISKKPGLKTIASIERFRHRPLEVVVTVDYTRVGKTSNVIRQNKSNSQDMTSYRWIWLLLVFGGAIVWLVNLLEGWISGLFGNSGEQLSQLQIIITVVILATIVAIFWIYGIPYLIRQKNSRMKQFDLEVLGILKSTIRNLDQEMITSDIVRCWSCFEEIEPQTKVCPSCGVEQK